MELSKGKLSNKNRRDSQIEVTTNWQYTQEISPAFKRLMMLLLQPNEDQLPEIIKIDEERDNEQN